ncbi:MAG TPA: 2'-deoxycytidine 5'-triphosphate deaminase [Aestuariivirgaceae bacterium]|nr:2'-deoxycytidine 5'-triphosphate deaminase [Aestuariivirgaceae bacterium]
MDKTRSIPAAFTATRPGAGILPAHAIRRLIEETVISAHVPIEADQIQPASLDLRLGEWAYRVRASFLPGPSQSMDERLRTLALHRFSLSVGVAA